LSDETTTVSLAALFVICSGAVWVWLLVQFVNFFVQPELNTLHEQIAGTGFF
jgi:energy-converting hydrogenase Eha subunit G